MKKKRGMMAAKLPEAVREVFREYGKRGGRPATAPHVEGWKGCRCAECRRAKAGERKPGAEERRLEVAHVSEAALYEDALYEDAVGVVAVEEEDPLEGMVEVPVPEEWMLVSEMSERSGYSEDDVRVAALAEKNNLKVQARLHKLADGRWVISRAWGDMQLKKLGRA